MFRLVTISIVILLQYAMIGRCTTINDVKRWFANHIDGYEKRVRPVQNQDKPMSIYVTFHANAIINFDEKSQAFAMAGGLFLKWYDENLIWLPENYGNLTSVTVNIQEIWRPNLGLNNPHSRSLSLPSSDAIVYADGQVTWFPSEIFEVTCNVKIRYYPMDVQVCVLEFVVLGSKVKDIVLIAEEQEIELHHFSENSIWNLQKSLVEEEEEDQMSKINFIFHVQRRPQFILMNTVIPILLLSFLNICTFLVPASCGEKNSFCITVYLSYAVFLGTINNSLPHNSKETSLLASYLLFLLIVSVTAILLSVLEVRLYNTIGHQPIPVFLQCICCSKLCQGHSNIINVKPLHDPKNSLQIKQEETFEQETMDVQSPQKNNDSVNYTWAEFMNKLDTFLFIGSLGLVVIVTIGLGITLAMGDNPDSP